MVEKIGSIKKILIFPVKSMKACEIDKVFVSFSGLIGDRVYAFVDKSKQNNFPWMTARQRHDMILYKPEFMNAIDPSFHYPNNEKLKVTVETPETKKYNINDNELLQELKQKTNKELELRFSQAGMQDSRPVSLLSFQSVDQLENEIDMKIDYRRFRMNLNVKWDNNKAFYEEELLGQKIRIGEKLILELTKKDARCSVITLDPDTAEQKIELLKHIAKKHGGCFGVYAVVIREGIVKTGDSIVLE